MCYSPRQCHWSQLYEHIALWLWYGPHTHIKMTVYLPPTVMSAARLHPRRTPRESEPSHSAGVKGTPAPATADPSAAGPTSTHQLTLLRTAWRSRSPTMAAEMDSPALNGGVNGVSEV